MYGSGVPFSAMMSSSSPGRICGARLSTRRATEAGRACVAIMMEVFNVARDFLSWAADAQAAAVRGRSGLNSKAEPVKPFHLPSARVAERQTRKAQDLVRATSWGFKSPLSHQRISPRSRRLPHPLESISRNICTREQCDEFDFIGR